MSGSDDTKPLSSSRLKGSVTEFASYCDQEFERRRNSSEPFDATLFKDTVEMVLNRLRTIEREGRL